MLDNLSNASVAQQPVCCGKQQYTSRVGARIIVYACGVPSSLLSYANIQYLNIYMEAYLIYLIFAIIYYNHIQCLKKLSVTVQLHKFGRLSSYSVSFFWIQTHKVGCVTCYQSMK